jgi:hypothetical protein
MKMLENGFKNANIKGNLLSPLEMKSLTYSINQSIIGN